ncbi:MAG: hypothetical protein DHS20C11_15920 [Lysobacteraceae bacterium]|nr:MAG: hypothetical protein DHS20C11_15920 [Xanthomonadaceae bacterium]
MAGKIKKTFKWLGLTLLVALLLGGGFVAHEWNADKPFYANNFYNRAFLKYVLDSPQQLTSMGILESIGITGHNAEWNDDSIAAGDREFEYLQDIMASMRLYSDEELSHNELISKKIVMELLGNPEQQKKFRYHGYPVNQISGLQVSIPRFLDTFHRVNTPEDAEHYIARLSKIDTKMEQNMESLLVSEQMGIIPPTFVIDKSVEIMQGFIDQPPEENVLYVSFDNKMQEAEGFDDATRMAFLDQARSEITATVYPAWQNYIDYFTQLREKSTTDAGVWKFPDGEEFYNYMLQVTTTTDMTADEIHRVGRAEVDRIQGEMMEIFAAEGYDTALGFSALITQLAEEERFYYPDTDEGREQILADYTAMIEEIDAGLDSAFKSKPKAPVEVRRVPEFSEKTASGAYYNGPSMDGSRPGIFYANLYDIKATPKYGMRTLAYHEAVPGHHYQIATQRELKGVPEFRKQTGFTAYSEGWALYSERVAWEMGFQDDPYDNLGRLQAELFRAVRLVVDTGIHAQRWTREQAIDYMSTNTGITESDVISEIERYIVWPGQATAYKVGMMEILRLREEARAALGDRFDIRDFHEVVLMNGPVPLHLLRDLVGQYIADKSS